MLLCYVHLFFERYKYKKSDWPRFGLPIETAQFRTACDVNRISQSYVCKENNITPSAVGVINLAGSAVGSGHLERLHPPSAVSIWLDQPFAHATYNFCCIFCLFYSIVERANAEFVHAAIPTIGYVSRCV